MLKFAKYKSLIGLIYIVSDGTKLRALVFASQWQQGLQFRFKEAQEGSDDLIDTAIIQAEQYLQGKRKKFNLPFELTGTPFEVLAWRALAKIPAGKTWTYQQQAQFIGRPKAYRAVGRANGQNPFCLLLPCHRVVGKSGQLTGYAGGLKAKEFLLRLENQV